MNTDTIVTETSRPGPRPEDASPSKPWYKLTGNQLKIIAVVLMVMDHVHQMFYPYGVPDWFTWFGRLVAPIFIFMCAEGFAYTRSRARYMLRLFVGFEFMNVFNQFFTRIMPNDDVVLINNIFGTLFLATVYMLAADTLRQGLKEKRFGRIALAFALILLPAATSIMPILLLNSPALAAAAPRWLLMASIGYVPSLIMAEGSAFFVLMGVLFYLYRNRIWIQTAVLALVSLHALYVGAGPQWMMVFAAVPLWMYNGLRGKGSKYFFYIFYPAHIYLFYAIAWFIR